MLFDYAVALVHFEACSGGLPEWLQEDPDLLLFARPSIDMYLDMAWNQGSPMFCELVLKLADPRMSPMAMTAVAEVIDLVRKLAPQYQASVPEHQRACGLAARMATGDDQVDGWTFWSLTVDGTTQTLSDLRDSLLAGTADGGTACHHAFPCSLTSPTPSETSDTHRNAHTEHAELTWQSGDTRASALYERLARECQALFGPNDVRILDVFSAHATRRCWCSARSFRPRAPSRCTPCGHQEPEAC